MKFIIKILFIAYCLLPSAYFSFSQNLVFNGSFEIKDSIYNPYKKEWYSCPYTDGDGPNGYNPQLPLAKGWSDPDGIYYWLYNGSIYDFFSSADFFHSCGNDISNLPNGITGTSVGVPKSYWLIGFQYPRTGEGYSAGVFYGNDNQYTNIDFGEYIQSKLNSKLMKDTIYKFTFYVNRGNLCSHSIETQGAYFSHNKIQFPDLLRGIKDSSVVAQVINTNGFISDTLNWIKIEGVFKANGDEEYITIGSFDVRKNLAKFEHTATYNGWAAYAVDDISLYTVNTQIESANCGNDTIICLGNSLRLGKTNVKTEYQEEYSFEWYIFGKDSLISKEEHPLVSPEITTTYFVKVLDIKFDKTYDTITVYVIDCALPTSLLVYPNPTNALVKFKFNSPIPEQLKIELYDVLGRKIRSTNYQQNYKIKEVRMNLFDLSSGIYFYKVIIGKERKFVGKIIKI